MAFTVMGKGGTQWQDAQAFSHASLITCFVGQSSAHHELVHGAAAALDAKGLQSVANAGDRCARRLCNHGIDLSLQQDAPPRVACSATLNPLENHTRTHAQVERWAHTSLRTTWSILLLLNEQPSFHKRTVSLRKGQFRKQLIASNVT